MELLAFDFSRGDDLLRDRFDLDCHCLFFSKYLHYFQTSRLDSTSGRTFLWITGNFATPWRDGQLCAADLCVEPTMG